MDLDFVTLPITVLVIDDCVEDSETFCRLLDSHSTYTYNLLSFTTIVEALEWCEQGILEIFVLTFYAPNGDVLASLHPFSPYLSRSQFAMVILAQEADEYVATSVIQQGAQDYLVKTQLTTRIVQSAIHQAVRRLSLTRQIEQSQEQQKITSNQVQAELVERQRIELRLIESEKQFRHTFEQAAVGISHLLLDERFVRINKRFCEILGYLPSELIYMTFSQITHQEDVSSHLHCQKMLLKGLIETFSVEKRCIKKHGSIVWVNLTVSLVRNHHQNPEYFISVIEDITKRKKAEAALYESETRFQIFMNNSPSASWISDENSKLFYANQKCFQTIQLESGSVEDLIGKTAFDLYPREIAQGFVNNLRHVAQTKEVLQIVEQVPKVDGTLANFLVYYFPLPLTCGVTCGELLIGGIAVDITERILAERALQQLNQELEARVDLRTAALQASNDRWELVLRGSNNGIWDWNVQTNQVFYSTRWKEMHGFAEDEVGHTLDEWSQRIHPDDYQRVMSGVNRLFVDKTYFFQAEYRVKCRDGTYIWVLGRGQSLWNSSDQVICIINLEKDITSRKQAEEELLYLSKMQTAILNGSDYFIISVNDQGIIQTFNAGAEKMLGYKAAEIIGQKTPMFFHRLEEVKQKLDAISLKLGREVDKDEFFKYVTKNGQIYEDEYTYIRKDGSHLSVSLSISALEDDIDKSILYIAIAKDITEQKQVELQLRKTATSLAAAQRIANLGSWELDLSNNKMIWSVELFRIFGRDLALGEPTYEEFCQFIHPDDLKKHESMIKQIIVQNHSYETEYRAYRQDGKLIYLLSRGQLILDSNGESRHFLGTMLDITGRKRAEEDLLDIERRYATLTQAAPVGIFRLDKAGNCIFANNSWSDLTGRPKELALGMRWLEAVHPDDRGYIMRNWLQWSQTSQLGQIYRAEGRHLRPDGSINWFYCHLLPETNASGVVFGYVGTLTDITERKYSEEKLRQTNQDLNNVNLELARATRLKDEFLANMSHELRTPLNAVLGMSESLLDNVFGPINNQQVKAIKTIEHSGKHLLELINDILDLAKIESGKLELELSDLPVKSLCDSSLVFVEQMALRKNIRLSTIIPSHPITIHVDDRRMRQVLINLLNNAVKFTPENGAVSLEVWLDDVGGYCCFSVNDTGIGISDKDLGKLFQPFVQIDSSLTRQYEGTGLGLLLVKQIVEMHGGEVSVKSQVNIGSSFLVRIPSPVNSGVNYTGSIASRSSFPDSNSDRGIKAIKYTVATLECPLILLVEDHQPNIDTMFDYLQSRGYNLLLAKNGKQAIELTKNQRPDLILMDIQMPEMDGLEAIRRIRTFTNLCELPIIALTALAMQSDREICLATGANEYLAKPVQLRYLTTIIQQLLAQRRKSSIEDI